MVGRRQHGCWAAAVIAGAIALPCDGAVAQLIVDPARITPPPWNSQRIFDITPPPILSYPEDREPLAPEDTPVKNRVHPEYQARGIRNGPWMFYPTVSASGFYDSNVFSSSNRVEDDFVSRFRAGLRAQSLWERHALELQLMAESLLYAHHPTLNQTDVELRARGQIDIDHDTQILTNLQAGYLHIEVGSLNSPAGAAEPTPYGFGSGDVTLRKQFGRWTASVGTRVDAYDFESVRALNGTIINNDSRDGQVYKVYERIDYAFSEKLGLFASFENNWRDLRGIAARPALPGPPPTPATPAMSIDSSGYRGLAGIDVEITRLIKSEFAIGYQSQDFTSPQITDVSGLAYRAFLTWSPTRRLDFFLNTEQVVTQISDTSTSSVLAQAVQAGFDYEFRPSTFLTASAVYEQDQFKTPQTQPLPPLPQLPRFRRDDVYAAELRIRHALNNVASVSAFYRYLQRDSNIPANSYDRSLIGFTASAQF